MAEDEESNRETAIKRYYKEAMKKMRRHDKRNRKEEDEKEEKVERDKGVREWKRSETNEKLKGERNGKMKKDIGNKVKSKKEKDNGIRKDRRNEEMEKDERNNEMKNVERKKKKNQISDKVRENERDEEIKVDKTEASTTIKKSTTDTDQSKSNDKIDDTIYKTLTPEMATEMKIRGMVFYENLGIGTFSIVKKAWCEMAAKVVAIKIIDTRKDSKYTKKCLPREIELVRKLEHDNIIKVYEVVEKIPYVCIIQEFTNRGDLLKKIRRRSKIDEKEGKIHFRQLIETMKYLKSMEVVHRDIKCENILLDSCENIKITDFGFARILKSGEKSKTFCGSRAYLAPEVIRAQPYDGYLSDMWSAGIVLYVMITGLMPYDDKNVRKMLERQLQHRIVYRRTTEISDDAKRLIYDILHPIPHKRLTIEEVIRSKWLTGVEYRILVEPVNDSVTTDSDDNS